MATTTKKTTKSAPAKKTAARSTSRTTAKKAPAKSTAKAKPVQHAETAKAYSEASHTPSTETAKTGVKINKSYLKYIILAAALIAFALLLYFFRGVFVAATVNGQPISRLSVVQESEKQSGKQVLSTLIRNTLIEQEARKQGVTVNQQEIDDEIKKLEANLQKQGQKIDQVLALQGMSREDLQKLIRLDKMVGKMVGKDIKISDQQVNEYIEKNRESLPEGQNEAELKKTVQEQLRQQQLNEKVRTWLENLQKSAKEESFVDYYEPAK